MNYSYISTRFGTLILVASAQGLMRTDFCIGKEGYELSQLREKYPNVEFIEKDNEHIRIAKQYLELLYARGEKERACEILKDIRTDICGTSFQKAVWKKLMDIPPGETSTYSHIAHSIDNPKAVRAVGSAVGKNPISVIIPCHRVVPVSGGIGNYHWGTDKKLSLLKYEEELNNLTRKK